jgi:L-malate glycosyltransferase
MHPLRYRILYPHMKNVDLIKESGMIAHFLCQIGKYEVALASYKNEEYTNMRVIDSKVSNDFITKRTGYAVLDSILYLFDQAKGIDILQLYHLNQASVILATVYKILHPQGIVYVKLDTSERHLQHLLLSDGVKGRLRRLVLQKKIDLVSAETAKIYNSVKDNWGALSHKLFYLPNGIASSNERNVEKQKIILTVGRIGAYEKATELLLSALCKSQLIDWTVQIVGPIEAEFTAYIDNWFIENPEMRDRVFFVGPVWDRKVLSEYYAKAAVFCLPSRWESFGFATLEAASEGCYLLLTPVGAAEDVVAITKYGMLFNVDDEAALVRCLNQVMSSWVYDPDQVEAVRGQIRDLFGWDKIIAVLDKNIADILIKKGRLHEN